PIRSIGSEYFHYDESRHALVGSRSGAMHRLGDVVDVRLVEAAPVAGALRFELLSQPGATSRSRSREGPPRERKPAKARPGRAAGEKKHKPEKRKSGKSKKGKSWKR
ncbi:MAG: ribonuclease R, partial [Bradyrhizobium sp.]|nr:ribonuclease R [Bradyrhizobium sp.]